jgi:hypothetical protein
MDENTNNTEISKELFKDYSKIKRRSTNDLGKNIYSLT